MVEPENTEGAFEKEWRESIEQASQAPPAAVWNNIDRKLAYAELSVYKAKNNLYKWAVAAILLIAVSLSVFQYLYFQNKQDILLSSSIDVDAPEYVANPNLRIEFPLRTNGSSNSIDDSNPNKKVLVAYQDDGGIKTSTASGNSVNTLSGKGVADFRQIQSIEKITSVNSFNPIAFTSARVAPNKMPIYHFEKMKSQSNSDKYWAGLGVGSGSFDPNFNNSGNGLVASNLASNPSAFSLASDEVLDVNSPTVREDMKVGQSISLGINFGVKLSDRWNLKSGIQYARVGTTTQTNVLLQSSQIQEALPVTGQIKRVEAYASAIEREPVLEYEYQDVSLNNDFQFASIPLSAGYMILDNKFKVEINAGLITNFYMGNKLQGSDDSIAEVTIGPGSESPYKTVSFSGLAGLEFGYQVMRNFDLIIEPNYRTGINNLTKGSSNFSANPSGFGVLTGIRYNFN